MHEAIKVFGIEHAGIQLSDIKVDGKPMKQLNTRRP
jgi:hypothetical protein